MFRKPKWWDTPITWGASVKMSLWGCLLSLVLFLIEGIAFGWFENQIDTVKNVIIVPCEKVSEMKDALGEKWDNIFHKEET